MENNGIKRSLKVTVTKTVNGVPASGYPKNYNGMTASSSWTGWIGTAYTSLTDLALAQLSDAAYEARLADFEAWVTSQESGINFNTQVLPTALPVIEDLTQCALPASYYMVEVLVNDASLGSAIGGGAKLQNSLCSIQAFPVAGAQFDGWKVNGEGTPSIGSQIHTFTVTDNISFEAVFSVIVVTTFQISYTNHVCQKV